MARHSRKVLRRMAEDHVAYELEAMAALSEVRSPPGAIGFGLLESYLLHVRCLDEFLTKPRGDRRWKQLVLASDYFEDPTAWQPAEGAFLSKDERFRIDRTIAHITTDRRSRVAWANQRTRRSSWARRGLDVFDEFLALLASHHPERARWFAAGRIAASQWIDAVERGEHAITATTLPPFGLAELIGGPQVREQIRDAVAVAHTSHSRIETRGYGSKSP